METEARYNRFKDAEWFGEQKEILIGGVGGTGSFMAFLLSRTGDHTFYLFDNDIYEEHNMAGQMVNISQINMPKVKAINDTIRSFSGDKVEVYSFNEMYDEDSVSNPICFACFDNMKGRKTMYYKWKELALEAEDPSQYLFVDLRLLAESMTIFVVQGHKDQFAKYEANLFDDNEVADAHCTFKQTTHASAIIAGITTGYFTSWVANRKEQYDYRTIPFRFDYLIGANAFENEY